MLNGDTIFKADFKKFLIFSSNKKRNLPLLILKESDINERYGGYEYNNAGWIFSNEKTNIYQWVPSSYLMKV